MDPNDGVLGDLTRLEHTLRSSRPRIDSRVASEIEERLLPAGRRRRQRPLAVGALAAGALAAIVLAIGLAGVGPLQIRSDRGVGAESDCRYVPVKRRIREPVVETRDGALKLRFRDRIVQRRVKRCP